MSKVGANTQTHRSGSTRIGRQFRHDFRKNNTYRNCHVDKSLSHLNIHFKEPVGTYTEDYEKMKSEGKVLESGLKEDGCNILSTIIDVESRYFDNDYEKAKQFFALEYERFKEKFGDENILGAVMHADERYVDDENGKEYIHYHLHIVYVPVATKEKRFSRATAKKDPDLYERDPNGDVIMVMETKKGKEQWLPLTKVKERINQVSHTNCMKQRFDTTDNRIAYQRLQDMVFDAVRGQFPDIERGEKKKNKKELDTLEYTAKKQREANRTLEEEKEQLQNQLDGYDDEMSFGLNDDFEEIIEEVHVPGLKEQVSDAEQQLKSVKGRIKDLETEYEEAAIKYDKNALEDEIEALKSEKAALQNDVKSLKGKLNDYLGIIKKAIRGLWVACRTGLLQAEDNEIEALFTVKKGQEEAHATVKPLDEVVRESVGESINELAEETNEQIRSFRRRGR